MFKSYLAKWVLLNENRSLLLNETNFTSSTFGKHDTICTTGTPHNYTNNYIDQLMYFKYIISGWITLFIIVFGIIANSVTICVLLNSYMRKSSTNAYLLALSISNISSLFCIFLMIALRFTIVHPYRKVFCTHWYEQFINLAAPFITPINNMFQLSGIYLTTAVSIDRYILINRNLKESLNRKSVTKFTWLIIFLVFLFSFLYTVPNWFLYKSEKQFIYFDEENFNIKTSSKQKPNFILSYVRTISTSFGENQLTKLVIHGYLYIPFVFALPVCTLLVVNFLIIKKLLNITRRKRLLGTLASIDRSITIMLIMVVVVFLVCQVPLMVLHILVIIKPNFMYTDFYLIFNTIATLCLCINLSINFALYCFYAESFRRTIQCMFCLRDDLGFVVGAPQRGPSIHINNGNRGKLMNVFSSFLPGNNGGSSTSLNASAIRKVSSNDMTVQIGQRKFLSTGNIFNTDNNRQNVGCGSCSNSSNNVLSDLNVSNHSALAGSNSTPKFDKYKYLPVQIANE